MKGSTLPQMPPQATWKAGACKPFSDFAFSGPTWSSLSDLASCAGAAVEVGWSLRAQHGGGYSYRLAPAAGPLTEQTFGQGPCSPKPASRSLRRALLTPQVNSGSFYRCGKRF